MFVKLTDHGVRRYLLGCSRGCRRSMRQKVAERQGRRDDLPLLLEVEVIQTVAALRRRHDCHRFRRRVMVVMMVMVLRLMMQIAVHAALVVAAVVGARAGGHQVNAAHAYRHRARSPILTTTPSLPAPRTEDRYEGRQRSYRLVSVNVARIPVCTCSRDRRRQRLASSSFTTSRSRLHGSTVRFARLPRARARSRDNDNDPRETSGSRVGPLAVVWLTIGDYRTFRNRARIWSSREATRLLREIFQLFVSCKLTSYNVISRAPWLLYVSNEWRCRYRLIADVEPIILDRDFFLVREATSLFYGTEHLDGIQGRRTKSHLNRDQLHGESLAIYNGIRRDWHLENNSRGEEPRERRWWLEESRVPAHQRMRKS